jgi:hypothetical protein
LDLVEKKYLALKNDIRIEEYISQHSAENDYKRLNGID